MITLINQGAFYYEGKYIENLPENSGLIKKIPNYENARKNTMAYEILKSHNKSDNMKQLNLEFDAAVSPDNNYVSILQTIRAVGVEKFPIPYVLTNCHNTLCATGGTVNEDDHVFGLDCAKKYGGIFIPPYMAVIHQYMREKMAGAGKMIMGSDSHTRYGPLGTMGIGEGGGEVAKQLLSQGYHLNMPEIVGIYLTGTPPEYTGPMDIALSLIGKTFKEGYTKNKILEFIGPGLKNLTMDTRLSLDAMTTESGALSSIWETDERTEAYLAIHGRQKDYKKLAPKEGACYDKFIVIDLSKIRPMMALPFHPSNVYSIVDFINNAEEILHAVDSEGEKITGSLNKAFSLSEKLGPKGFKIQQALISGCAGGMFENICAAADILKGTSINTSEINLGINPASQAVNRMLIKNGTALSLMDSGAAIRPCICGPCFGVTDTPAHNTVSVRHVTRNYAAREGSKPAQGQLAASIIMDSRSIAATVLNKGYLTSAENLNTKFNKYTYEFDENIYNKQIYYGYSAPTPSQSITMGPNIGDWPEIPPLGEHILIEAAGCYSTPVTTDELVPSGEASSHRSNPDKIAEYTLISKDKNYVSKAKQIRQANLSRSLLSEKYETACNLIKDTWHVDSENIQIGSFLHAPEIGDGSSREHAVSCQKVLGGIANIAGSYATKRYISNLINWGILPFTRPFEEDIKEGALIFIPHIKNHLQLGEKDIKAWVLEETPREISLSLPDMTGEEKETILKGNLINYYKTGR